MMKQSNDSFKGQVAIVTGACSGLGLAMSKTLFALGVKLALFDLNREKLAEIKMQFFNNEVEIYHLDISNESNVKESVEQVIKHFGRIDILINSAGITGQTALKSHEVDTENLLSVFGVNFMGAWFTSKYVIPYMLEKNYGRVLNIASIAGKEGNAGMLAYSSSKAAVIGMTKVQGKEYAETGVVVNALAPAVIRTALVDAMPEQQVKYMTDKIPMKRCGTLEEATALATFIVSEANSFTTGFTFDLSGGRATY